MFKIDTKNGFYVISSACTNIDENFVRSFQDKLNEHCKGKMSTILHLEACKEIDTAMANQLQQWQDYAVKEKQSFAICAEQRDLYTSLQKLQNDHELNLSPSLAEAIDLVSMEILERELLG